MKGLEERVTGKTERRAVSTNLVGRYIRFMDTGIPDMSALKDRVGRRFEITAIWVHGQSGELRLAISDILTGQLSEISGAGSDQGQEYRILEYKYAH